jgi:hypothetical protein
VFLPGYAGVFLYNQSADSFALISGTMKPYGRPGYIYDIDANVQNILKRSLATKDTVTGQGMINGENMQIAATRVDASFQVNADYDHKALPEFYPCVFIVRGSSLSEWIPVQQRQLGILIFTVVFQLIVLVVTAVLVYRPISKFLLYLDEQKSPSKKEMKSLRKKFQLGSSRNREGSSDQLSSALPTHNQKQEQLTRQI